MNEYEQKDNSGVLFKNDKRETENHPDYKGNIRVAGVDYWLSSWINTSKNGVKYMAVSVQPKEQQAPQKLDQAAADSFDASEEMPF